MTPSSSLVGRVCLEFDEFRVDPVRRRLWRDGDLVPITPKAFSILLVLLEKRGEIVEKEDLIKEVWPDLFVTEANLTQNISSLRKALGERANDRRYVVTVPGRGYSFAGDVIEVPRDSTGEISLAQVAREVAGVAEPTPTEAGEEAPPPGAKPSPGPPPSPLAPLGAPRDSGSPAAPEPSRQRWGWPVGAALAVAAGAWLLLAPPWRTPPPRARPAAATPAGAVPARPSVAVLGFKNLSGRSEHEWLATALGEMLTSELAASPTARVLASGNVAQARRALPAEAVDNPGPEQLERLHASLGADLVVLGAYLVTPGPDGERIRLDLSVLRAPGGEVVTALRQVGAEASLLDLVAAVGIDLRHRLRWAEPSLEQVRAAAALQPATPEATRLYAQGLARLRAFDAAGARDLFNQAITADPNSATLRSALSQALAELGSDVESLRQAEAALRLAGTLPREERLEIEARSNEAKKEWGRASEIYRSLWILHPDNLEYGLQLAQSLSIAGQTSEAAAALAELRRLPRPFRDDPRIDLTESRNARRLADPNLELRAARTAEAKGEHLALSQVIAEALLLEGDAHFSMGQTEESARNLQAALQRFTEAKNEAAIARTLNRLGATYLDSGRLAAAEETFERARAIAERLGSRELTAAQVFILGATATLRGDLVRARALCEEAYRRFMALGDRFYEARSLYFLADVLWLSGDVRTAGDQYEQVLTMARDSHNRVDEARAEEALGRLLVDGGRFSEGRRRQETARRIGVAVGDKVRSSSFLASVGETLVLEGDFEAAQAQLHQALAEKQRVQDLAGVSTVLGRLAALAYRRGALADSRQLADRQLALARQVGARLDEADALRNEARLDLVAGDLRTAHLRLGEAAGLAQRLGAGRLAAELKVDQARLALAEGRVSEAAELANAATAWFYTRSISRWEGRALVVLADAALAAGRVSQAGDAATRALSLAASPTDVDRELKLASWLRDAEVAAARGLYAEASGHLVGLLREAEKGGEIPIWLEARWVQGSLEKRQGHRAAAAAILTSLVRDATPRGFLAMARRAQAALAP
jgi:DNA-binding winged helix-turn-helix (wHTH) protein/TolB-like protein